MTKKMSLRFLIVLASVAFTAFVTVFADYGVLAQNTNSSTTQDDTTQAENTNTNTTNTGRRRRGRRGRRSSRAVVQPTTDAPLEVQAPTGGGAAADDTDTGTQSPGTQEDLSGTYTGRITMTGGHEMSGEATLTITGNSFTLASEGMTHNGRVLAVTTRGYTGASFYFTDITDSTTNTPVVASTRARRSGDRLTLTPVPGTRTRMTFTSGGSGGRGRRSR